ncbi:MAG: S1/P1 nuclease [Proteobacteria bacterium]|nr:S1/P1 nuclease [Pseudomonadota bacterium]
MMRRTLIATTFLCAILNAPAYAWDAAGHRMACVKAWREMTDPARAAVSDLLSVKTPEEFANTCTWADDVATKRPETAGWHFINVPKTARTIDLARDCKPPTSCVVTQIERQAEIVGSEAPKAARAEALRFLTHLMADLHQPLDVAFAEDHGGRDIKVTFLGKPADMHAVWDSLILTAPNPPSRGYTPFLQDMADRHNRERWNVGTAKDWAEETLWIMRAPPTGYVGNPGGLVFDDIYVEQNYLVATDQIDKSGVRLAFVLNGIFK